MVLSRIGSPDIYWSIRKVLRKYITHTDFTLSYLTHAEGTPWDTQWKKKPYGEISEDEIYEYFKSKYKEDVVTLQK